MGSAISRCNSRHSDATAGLSDVGQKVFKRQPNWLVTPSKWRSHQCDHQPVRYRTPTPYPKDDRKRIDDHNEKVLIIETPTIHRVELGRGLPSEKVPVTSLKPHNNPHMKFPTSTVTITWECHPRRLNRFERPS
ncbi:hypothetical protein QBC42DRAFT_250457 [Cladorrhinum samala]|uniref:Uncharacterized protein n=1 Tax=Cladorrhinum samala TaxID=585594 RepID=A0AAV9HUR7_9PEZI|nr:hypothetical protein QBC42DRAFT_250457 [Cladorrhinum samala]